MSALPLSDAAIAKLVEVIESLAFLIPFGEVPCPDDSPWGVVVVLPWTATDRRSRGDLWLALTPDAAAEAARNMCGLAPDQPLAAGDAAEATGELANVLLGNLLPLIHGAEAEFHLGAPVSGVPANFPREGARAIDLGGGLLAVAIISEEL